MITPHVFTYVKEEINRADIAIANLEVTLGEKPYRGYPAFSARMNIFSPFAMVGFNVLVTANNHSLDRGKSDGENHFTNRLLKGFTRRHVYQR